MSRLVLSLLLFSAASSAAAQVRMESPNPAPDVPSGDVFIPGSQEDLNIRQVREAMRKFAECVVRRHPTEAHEFVIDMIGQSKQQNKLFDSDCLVDAVQDPDEVTLSTMPDEMKYALAEVLIRKNLATFDPTQLSKEPSLPIVLVDPVDYAPRPGEKVSATRMRELQQEMARDQSYNALNALGECVVRADPMGARNLVDTRAGSTQETSALQAISSAFGSCLPKGRQFHSDATTLRGTVALSYYRLAHAAEVRAAATNGRPQ